MALNMNIGKLGFGLMRLPRTEDGQIDHDHFCSMVDAFMDAGFTYFDTAWVYGGSEEATRKALVERYPRESYQLATKGISWVCGSAEEAQAQFTTSLERTGAGYFDFYLLHMTGSGREQAFEKFDMWNFCMKQKEAGLIKHLGFSHHGKADELDQILTAHPEAEFVQLQVNYLDWESPLHESRKSMEVAAKHGVRVVVMEPIRGGLLADPPATVASVLKAADPDLSPAGWALRFAANDPNVLTVLSGMSNLQQMQENVVTMKDFDSLDEAGLAAVAAAQEEFSKFDLVPCTACNYCSHACPANIGISGALLALNANRMFGRHVQEWIVAGSGRAVPSACIECGACESMCPQGLKIVDLLKEAAELIG